MADALTKKERKKEANRRYYEKVKMAQKGLTEPKLSTEPPKPALSLVSEKSETFPQDGLDSVTPKIDLNQALPERAASLRLIFFRLVVLGLTGFLTVMQYETYQDAGEKYPLGLALAVELSIVALALIRGANFRQRLAVNGLVLGLLAYSGGSMSVGVLARADRNLGLRRGRVAAQDAKEAEVALLQRKLAVAESQLPLAIAAEAWGRVNRLTKSMDDTTAALRGLYQARQAVPEPAGDAEWIERGRALALVTLRLFLCLANIALIRLGCMRTRETTAEPHK